MKPITPKGFTLIELLVVISIIGMLASIILVSLNNARTKAKNARIQESVQQIRNAIETSYNGSAYTAVLIDNNFSQTGVFVAVFDTSSPYGMMNANVFTLINEILKQNGKAYGGGGAAPCLGSGINYYAVDTASGYDPLQNGMTIFTDAHPNPSCPTVNVYPKKYAIFAAYIPVGSAGYFCIDSSGRTVSNTTAVGIPTAPGVNTTCI